MGANTTHNGTGMDWLEDGGEVVVGRRYAELVCGPEQKGKRMPSDLCSAGLEQSLRDLPIAHRALSLSQRTGALIQ